MAMLAERRRKQKWAVDPRNTAWSNDDSKFGQRMLEKMGWSKGKGLGAQEQGATEHIKVHVKNDHLGLGAAVANEDNWIAHQDGFNQLLAELNSCHGREPADSSGKKKKKSFSLEEKSKVSKSRVHYTKFTKGKDLSSRSKTDLDCIFGKRQAKKTPEEDSRPATPDGHAPSSTTTTTTSAFTIQEYFAQRMAKLRGEAQRPSPPEDRPGRKKAKKRKKEADENTQTHAPPQAARPGKRELGVSPPGDPGGDEGAAAPAHDGEDGEAEPPSPGHRRRKQRPRECGVEASPDEAPPAEAPPDEAPVRRKKRKKKKKGSA